MPLESEPARKCPGSLFTGAEIALPHIRADTTARAWDKSLTLFLGDGPLNRYTSRGDPCSEVEDVLFEISQPLRQPQISEAFPRSLIGFVDQFRERLTEEQFGQTSKLNDRLYRWRQRDGSTLNQHEVVSALLRDYPDGRYSVISFWDPEEELTNDRQVGPLMAYPRIRGGKLNLSVVTRTLDAITGAVQILVGFAGYQELLANELAVKVGHLRVFALSYHLLDVDLPRVIALARR
jgi:hypothetical protein